MAGYIYVIAWFVLILFFAIKIRQNFSPSPISTPVKNSLRLPRAKGDQNLDEIVASGANEYIWQPMYILCPVLSGNFPKRGKVQNAFRRTNPDLM